jgi:hypothetical protein
MKLLVEESDRALVREIMENLPEYSYSHLRCVGYDYDKPEYAFVEPDEKGKKHILTLDKAMEGFQKYLDHVVKNGGSPEGFTDAGNYDAMMVDCIVQFALLGELVYG